MLRNYISLTKPGIIAGNLVTASGGFFAASGPFHILPYLLMLAGLALVIASGGVFNNYIDQDIDPLMRRTRQRVSALGLVSGRGMLVFGLILVIPGILLLGVINLLTAMLATGALLIYVLVYSLWLKRSDSYGTLGGAIAGASPPLIGYCAATGQVDLLGLSLFAVLFVWQMPHFYAIAIYRLDDYQSARLPVLPVIKGVEEAKKSIVGYVMAFLPISLLPFFFGAGGIIYLSVMLALGILWLAWAARGFNILDDQRWARRMFLFSIVVIMLWAVLLMI